LEFSASDFEFVSDFGFRYSDFPGGAVSKTLISFRRWMKHATISPTALR
jgi:hypothetical protein